MRAYDLEALAREVFERHEKRMCTRVPWDDAPGYIHGYWRSMVREIVECYERQLDELEKQAKREGRKGMR